MSCDFKQMAFFKKTFDAYGNTIDIPMAQAYFFPVNMRLQRQMPFVMAQKSI